MYVRRAAALFLALIFGAVVAGCTHPERAPDATVVVDAQATQADTAQAVAAAQTDAATAAVPKIVDARSALDAVAPPPASAPCDTDPEAVDLIVRYEVTSPAYYTAHLQAPIWPGEQSGVTWGVGYDGGAQTRARIAADWRQHSQVDRLVVTSGIVGQPARALIPGLADVRTNYVMAADVFGASTLPSYCALTARTFRNGWDTLPSRVRGALVATVYNRGAGMQGDRRREMRELRDTCVPAGDVGCIARELRSMTRLWVGTSIEAGMRARYEAIATLAERSSAS